MRRAVTKPYLLFSLLFIAILASFVVIAAAVSNDTISVTANTTDASITDIPVLSAQTLAVVQALAPDATVQPDLITNNGKPLSTPVQAINACAQNDSCTTTGYVAAASAVIDTTGYNCTVTDDGKVYLTCDSIYDGNGDGKCTSGESCIQFGIVGNYVTRKERNSQDTFVDYDTTYVMTRAEVRE